MRGPAYLYNFCRDLFRGRLLALRSKHLDKIHAALPTLEPALVNTSLDVVAPQPGPVSVDAFFRLILRHELDTYIPQLAPGQAHRRPIVQRYV